MCSLYFIFLRALSCTIFPSFQLPRSLAIRRDHVILALANRM